MPDAIRTLVVDDEPIARRTLELLLAQDPDIEWLGACVALEAERAIAEQRPDLLFLDVEMPELDGFSLLERVGLETVPAVVFVTAFPRHALKAFDVDAVDFLLKPFDDARFAETLRRAKAALVRASPDPDTPRHTLRLVVRHSGRIRVIDVADVDWIEAADYYACLHVGEQGYLVRQTMTELERSLDPARFFRVHRSSIVNLARVREATADSVRLDRVKLRMSQGRLEALHRRLSGGPSRG